MLRKSFLTALALSVSLSAQADFKLGARYYDQGKLEKAYEEFLLAASYGDYDAQYNLGAMYFQGKYVEKSLPQSYAWFALAQQSPAYEEKQLAKRILAQLEGAAREKALAEKERLFERYADAHILSRLSPELTVSQSEQRDYRPKIKKAPDYPRSMARKGRQGWVDISFTVAEDGTTRDHNILYTPSESFGEASLEAVRQWRYDPRIVDGQPVAVTGVQNRMIFQLEGSRIINEKLEEFITEARENAQKGGPDEQFHYAYFAGSMVSFSNKMRDESDEPKTYDINANKWYERAASQGHSSAAYFLGKNLLRGKACERDSYKSAGWLMRSASSGNADAQYTLAVEYLSGAYLEKDITKGLYWLERAAEHKTSARLRYAWYLSTYPDDERRDLARARQQLEAIDDGYVDKLTLYEVKAAVAAEAGDWKAAQKWQEKAVDEADDLDLPTASFEKKLQTYQQNKPWRQNA